MSISKIISRFSNNNSAVVYISTIDSPVGNITAAADDDFLYVVSPEDSKNYEKGFESLAKHLSCKFLIGKNKILQKFEDEIAAYFEGKLKKFTVRIKTFGSDFQKSVWDKLVDIPYGSTQSYSDLAKSLGRPASHSRAVGAACGANALLIVIPCHRLVSTASIGGFNSGVDRKEKLIEHEKKFA